MHEELSITATGKITTISSEKAVWHMFNVPKEASDKIHFFSSGPKRGWGSVRVAVTAGESTWRTSLFPSAKTGCYMLPIKVAIRKAEGISSGDTITLQLDILT